MKGIASIIKFDLTNALRDSMVVYILAAPILIAGGLRLFLPSVEGSVAASRFAGGSSGGGRRVRCDASMDRRRFADRPRDSNVRARRALPDGRRSAHAGARKR
jgi:hypothetical protein